MENLFRYFMESSSDLIALVDLDSRITLINDSYLNALLMEKSQILGRPVSEIWSCSECIEDLEVHLQHAFDGEELTFMERHTFPEKTIKLRITLHPYLQKGRVSHVIIVLHDISDLSSLQNRLSHYEFHDTTTGLFNRRSLDIILDMELEKVIHDTVYPRRALFFISVNNLGNVNEVLGFETGDLLLENIGFRIKEILRNSDYLFRFEGNQLAVLLTEFEHRSELGDVAERIGDIISMPYYAVESDIHLGSSIGISLYPEDSVNRDELIQHASAARKEAKRCRKDMIFWDKELHEVSLERLQLKDELTRAFKNNEFTIHYQPVVDKQRNILGGEALVRWNHPERGLLHPNKFIGILEESGTISALTHWMIFQVADQLKRMLEYRDIYLTINLSARDFEDHHLPQIVANASKNGIPTPNLRFELTESACVQDVANSLNIMDTLKEYKHELLIDDFGTGQSSLGYLYRIPAKTLKIDKMFVDRICQDSDQFSYLQDIIRLVKNRDKKVLVEGVGSKDQFELLKNEDIDAFQGFYFSKPVDSKTFEKLIRDNVKLPL